LILVVSSRYEISLKALSSDSRVDDSDMSNILVLTTGSTTARGGGHGALNGTLDDDEDDDVMLLPDDSELALRVVRVADTSIHLDWSQYNESADVVYYRVVWSSAAQPAVSRADHF